MARTDQIAVVDLFAGPGGLGEGFSQFRDTRGRRPFRIALSVEMDPEAHRTLRLRAFFRQYVSESRPVPEAYYRVLRGECPPESLENTRCEAAWNAAGEESLLAQLGSPDDDEAIEHRLGLLRRRTKGKPLLLIGGPPCQAYSLVGRSRNKGIKDYVSDHDHRHRLYLQYLRVISRTWPAVFVMENVKGILSSRLENRLIFPRILEDLENPGRATRTTKATAPATEKYRLLAFAPESDFSPTLSLEGGPIDPRDFIVRCERYGIPQRRHRVFIIGIREDLVGAMARPTARHTASTVFDAIGELPRIRAGESNSRVRGNNGKRFGRNLSEALLREIKAACGQHVAARCREALQVDPNLSRGADFIPGDPPGAGTRELTEWFADSRLGGICNHVSKSHMPSDLARYLFASCFAMAEGRSPRLTDFPASLLPDHKNAKSAGSGRVVFNDRFRVQLWDEPAATITSHIAKDGHYFIHPDPVQCRSLTVREAARLQTFPDSYFFCGPRTAQYHQVGNAVPPLMARRIAESVHGLLNAAGS